jgi:outer membrane PBP1 activator LpoA protein
MLAKLNMYLGRVGRLQSLGEILKDPLSEAVKSLPNVLRYLVGLWVIENRKDLPEVCSFLGRSSLEPLIPLLFEGPAASFPQHCGPLFKRLVPVFQARGQFAGLVRFVLNRENGIADLAEFLLGKEAAAAQVAIGASNQDKQKSVCVSPERI